MILMAVGPGGSGTRVLSTTWPFTDGLTAETTKTDGRIFHLIPEEGSLIPKRITVGIR